MTQNAIGKELKIARVIAELSQKELAAAVGITVPYLSAVENGAYIPSDRLLDDLKEAVRWTPQIGVLVRASQAAPSPPAATGGDND